MGGSGRTGVSAARSERRGRVRENSILEPAIGQYGAEEKVLLQSGSAHRVGIAAVGGTGLPGPTVASNPHGFGLWIWDSQSRSPPRSRGDGRARDAGRPVLQPNYLGTVGLPVMSVPLY